MADAGPLPPGPFATILCDPPWAFKTYAGAHVPTLAENPYTTMDAVALRALPVNLISSSDCALFMWIVGAHLPEALELGAAWGFTYRTDAFIWIKSRQDYDPVPGMGYWTRKGAETCLLFTRGHPPRLSKAVAQVIHCPRGQHSAKPDVTYERIEALVGGPRLELFARSRRPGWTSWGDQVGMRDGGLFDRLDRGQDPSAIGHDAEGSNGTGGNHSTGPIRPPESPLGGKVDSG